MNALTVSRALVAAATAINKATVVVVDAVEYATFRWILKAKDLHLNRLRAARKAGADDVVAASIRTAKFVADCQTRSQEQAHAATVAEAEMEAKRRKQAAVNVALSLEAAKYGRSL